VLPDAIGGFLYVGHVRTTPAKFELYRILVPVRVADLIHRLYADTVPAVCEAIEDHTKVAGTGGRWLMLEKPS
jgi:hypothetical protein